MRGSSRRRGTLAGVLAAALLAVTTAASPVEDPATTTGSRPSATVLDPWFTALKGSGSAPATVIVLGDSVSEG